MPFGQDRATSPTSWPGGDDGYVGGAPDSATGLENLGAREYDPTDGRFISADPVLETTDPTQLGGYDYSGNDPVTESDPSGAMIYDPVTGLGYGNATVQHNIYKEQGCIDSHGRSTAKYNALLYHYDAYTVPTWQYFSKPKPKPAPKKSGFSVSQYVKKVGSLAYHYSGASDVVGCVSDPSLGGCVSAGLVVGGFLATGG